MSGKVSHHRPLGRSQVGSGDSMYVRVRADRRELRLGNSRLGDGIARRNRETRETTS